MAEPVKPPKLKLVTPFHYAEDTEHILTQEDIDAGAEFGLNTPSGVPPGHELSAHEQDVLAKERKEADRSNKSVKRLLQKQYNSDNWRNYSIWLTKYARPKLLKEMWPTTTYISQHGEATKLELELTKPEKSILNKKVYAIQGERYPYDRTVDYSELLESLNKDRT